MKLLENYNSAKQKYGVELVERMVNSGIPKEYLLSACRFYTEIGTPINRLQQLFRQWMTYVVRKDTTIDVNRLSFNDFYNTIQRFKLSYQIPNIIYRDSKVRIGKILSSKDISQLPITNTWCIKQPGMFQKYIDNGCSFYLIDNGNESDFIRYVMLMIDKTGQKSYYDLDNLRLDGQDIEELKTHLSPKSITFISNLTGRNNKGREIKGKTKKVIGEADESQKKESV